MTTELRPTPAAQELPAAAAAETERTNEEAPPLDIRLRAQANMHRPLRRPDFPSQARPGRALLAAFA